MTSDTCPHCEGSLLRWTTPGEINYLCQDPACRFAQAIFKPALNERAVRRKIQQVRKKFRGHDEEE